MFDKHIIIHTHIPKCGGGSVNAGVAEIFGKERVLIYKDNVFKRSKPDILTPEERARRWFYAGHFGYGDKDVPLFNRTPLYIATVRDPLSRLLSSYGWFTSNRRNSLHEMMKGLTYDEAARAMIEMDHPSTRNSQCERLSKFSTFDLARKHIEANYLAVATCNSVNAVLELFAQVFARSDLEFLHRHARTTEKPTLHPETEALMRERTSEDAKLAAWVADNEAAWLERARERLIELLETEIHQARREYALGVPTTADARLRALDLRQEAADEPVAAAAYWANTHARVEALKALTEVALSRRDFEQARGLYARYRALRPDANEDEDFDRRLEGLRISRLVEDAVVADLQGRTEDADTILRQAAESTGPEGDGLAAAGKAVMQGADAECVIALAELVLRRRRLDLAADLFRRFVQLAPEDARSAHARDMVGRAEAERRLIKALKDVHAGRQASAETLLKKALAFDPGPDFPDAYLHLRSGQPVELMLAAIRHRTTTRMLIRLLYARKETDLALRCDLWVWEAGGRKGPKPSAPKPTFLQKAAALLRIPGLGVRQAA